MTEPRTQELQRYVRFTKKDATLIAAFAPRAAPHFQRIAQDFYERIREHEDAHKLFTGEEQIARLQRSMVAWLDRFFGGVYDDAYFAKTEEIGRVHVRVGLPQRYMPLAMSLIRSGIVRIIEQDETLSKSIASETAEAVAKLFDIELTVMLESYQNHLLARVNRIEQLKEQAAQRRATFLEEASVRAIEIAPLLIIALDRAGSILLFNRAAEMLTGYAQDEVLGRGFVDTLLPESIRVVQRSAFEIQTASQGNVNAAGVVVRESSTTLPLRLRSGKTRNIRWEIARAPSENESVATFLFGIDVTETEVDQERRDQDRRALALGTLAAGLAHEIRNPLNGARLHASFLERALLNKTMKAGEEALEAIRTVNAEIQRIAHLVTDVLDYAQPSPLALSPTSVNALCEKSIELVRMAPLSAPIPASISITTDLPANDSIIDADGQKLDRALTNLLENAIESITGTGAAGATGKISGNIIVRSRREPNAVWIEVEDDGPGFSADKPLFDAFFSTKATGTGLGLSIVHRIVTDHGGTITAESKDRRTSFRIRLPLSASLSPPVPDNSNDEASSSSSTG